ncbi:MAG: DNA-directed RNA polymerase subunit beta, partial [Patescibacteria group bacterium]|nr:DNA-directed RNA polymerase subunit beta [Patescibacteria group bacterium]
MTSRLPVRKISTHPGNFVSQHSLASIQLDSYRWFREKGLRELFDEISPITDYSGKDIEIHFLDYAFESPKHSETESISKGITFEAPLRVNVRLVNKALKINKEQEVYLGDYPIMTERGTFIINGVERVIVSQLIRSPGVYFTSEVYRGRNLFGAKLIPNRGVWLEFETDPDGGIGVKIDRHRKVPVTCLLKVFGLKNEDIISTFGKSIEPTLKKDSSKDRKDAYLELFKRVRPGDIGTVADATRLIDAMFQKTDRYDLSVVGRFKLNQRLDIKNSSSRLLTLEDIVKIVKELMHLNADEQAEDDDIDHLGNRRVRPVGELLQSRLRVGFARLRRNIQDKMSMIEPEVMTPAQLINPQPLISFVREFFSSSQMSQFMNQVNPLSEVEHKRRVTVLGPGGLSRERAGIEVRDVHESYYGRICPVQTPEGQNIGLISQLSNFAKLDEYNFLVTPYVKIKDGKVTDEVIWLNATDEQKYHIASSDIRVDSKGNILNEEAECRFGGKPAIYSKKDIELMDVAPQQVLSTAASLIPFMEHDDSQRALMASNMQGQAVPCVMPSAPYVGTGMEDLVARDSGYLVFAPEDGEITEVDGSKVVMKMKDGKTFRHDLTKFKMSNQDTAINQRPLVSKSDKVKKGDVLVSGHSIDEKTLALGQNLVVAFASFEGANFEDAIVLSERVQQEDLFTSIHIESFSEDVRDTKLGPEITTPDIPNVSEDKLRNLDEDGIIRKGAEVRDGDILVGKISPKGESELTPEERLVQAIFGEKARDVKDSSLTLPHGKSGRVVDIKIFSREKGDKLEPGVIKRIQVQVAELRNIRAGDKMAGRHGNKGVVSQIRPVEDMPYLEDGTPVDIVLNPLGIPSRMNLGQVLETHLGWAAKKMGYRVETPIFTGAESLAIFHFHNHLRAIDFSYFSIFWSEHQVTGVT